MRKQIVNSHQQMKTNKIIIFRNTQVILVRQSLINNLPHDNIYLFDRYHRTTIDRKITTTCIISRYQSLFL